MENAMTSNMTHEEAIAKAVKLLRLAQSDNPNEAALAAARAQDIMTRYKLTGLSADLDTTKAEPDEPIVNCYEPIEAKQGSTWIVRLIVALAEANQCKPYKMHSATHVVGRPSDVETVRYLYSWLKLEVNRLATVHGRGYTAVWKNNFRLGVVDTIVTKIRESKKATAAAVVAEAANPGAIVLVQNALAKLEQRSAAVEKWMQDNMKMRQGRRYSGGQSDHGARAAGQKAGESINLNGGHKPLTSAAKKLNA
jgi:hypothetical protein